MPAHEKPVIFSAPMVRAILDGRKTQTRRLVKPLGLHYEYRFAEHRIGRFTDPVTGNLTGQFNIVQCPYGAPGDVIWVRETWQYSGWTEDGYPFITYRADGVKKLHESYDEEWADRLTDIWAALSEPSNYNIDQRAADRKWRPAIFLPRWASRLSLRVTAVRCERLQEISKSDAKAEGFGPRQAVTLFRNTWDVLNAKRAPWESNPWVWVYTFERTSLPAASRGEK